MNRSMMFSIAAMMAAAAQSPLAQCDPNWVGIGLSVGQSQNGHVAAVRGNDGKIRLNEWSINTASWSGWSELPDQDGIISEPWVEIQTGAYQNVFARTNDAVIQWYRQWNGSTWESPVRVSISNSGNSFTGRVAVASSDVNGSQPTAFVFATTTNGSLKMWKWNGSSAEDWVDVGITGIYGSPYAEQVDATTFNVIVRSGDGSIKQRTYTNGVPNPTGWMNVPDNGSGDPAVAHTTYPFFYSPTSDDKTMSFAWITHSYGGSWSSHDDMSFPGVLNLSPVPVSGGTAYLYGRDRYGKIWRATRVGNQSLTNVGMVNCVTP